MSIYFTLTVAVAAIYLSAGAARLLEGHKAEASRHIILSALYTCMAFAH